MIKDHITALDFWNAEKERKDSNQNDSEGGDSNNDDEEEEIVQLDHIKFIAPQKACSFRDFEMSDLIKDDPTLCALRRKIVQHLRQFFEDNSVPHNAFPAIKPDEMVWST